MSPGIRDLKVWQESVALGGDIVRAVRRHGRRETKAFTDLLLTGAGTVASLVAEGYGRGSAADQQQCYQRAKSALLDLETQLAIAKHAELIPAATTTQISSRAQAVGRLLGGYMAHLERQVEAERALPRVFEPGMNGGAAAGLHRASH